MMWGTAVANGDSKRETSGALLPAVSTAVSTRRMRALRKIEMRTGDGMKSNTKKVETLLRCRIPYDGGTELHACPGNHAAG